VKRDIDERKVMVKKKKCVKIKEFGIEKMIDINEDEYKEDGGKMKIKWLEIECIQHRIFKKKSDVWYLGVKVWEMMN
jgi:hypothetical protein